MVDISRIFILAHDSFEGCACGNPLEEGDEGGYIDGELSCGDCVREAEDKDPLLRKAKVKRDGTSKA